MAKTPFDHINAIYNNQRTDYFDSLDDADRKTFNVYVINMGISMNPNFLPIVNEVNKYWGQLGPREVYLFYSQTIPKGRYFNKWVKGKKDESHDQWMIDLIARKFQVSSHEATEYITEFYRTDEGRAELKSILEGFGIEPKKLKKAKL